ncbi:MAG: glycosyltransferase [Nanoarchaeota archaeon]|nr:glycosyltransferase [Nanoarchaeota archaeon]
MTYSNFLFELSWEVCNKVGGIHTVISSKSREIMKKFQNYYFIGPYFESSLKAFEEKEVPKKYEEKYSKLLEMGIKIHFGNWKIDTNPNTILIEYLGYSSNINEVKKTLWDNFKIDSIRSQWYDFDEAILWSWVSGIVIKILSEDSNESVIIHAHEWMSGGAIFYVKSIENIIEKKKFRTVFTTHATMLGRALSGTGNNLYEIVDKINADEKAYEIGVETKHQSERALAHISECFTTVSDITNNEAKYFYSKEADKILYNGFDNFNIKNIDELNIDFEKSRKDINEFLEAYFHSFYDLNLDETQVFYTSGRNEFRNKGVDIYIKALGKLNKKFKEENSSKNIINLFLIPIGNFNEDTMIRKSIEDYNAGKKGERIHKIAPFSTNEIPSENEIISSFIKEDLLNRKEDKIKVIVVPLYLDGDDTFFKKKYYKIIEGLDLGIFPSYYEPWGYTPMESISYAVPTITSDFAGFGKYIKKNIKEQNGVLILEREGKNFEESSEILYQQLLKFSKMNKKELLNQRIEAKNLSTIFDWKKFAQNYFEAYDKILKE